MHSAWAYLLAKQALYLLSYGPVFCPPPSMLLRVDEFLTTARRPTTTTILAQSTAQRT